MENELTIDELMNIAHRYSLQAERAIDSAEKERFTKLADDYHMKSLEEIHKVSTNHLSETDKENFELYYESAVNHMNKSAAEVALAEQAMVTSKASQETEEVSRTR